MIIIKTHINRSIRARNCGSSDAKTGKPNYEIRTMHKIRRHRKKNVSIMSNSCIANCLAFSLKFLSFRLCCLFGLSPSSSSLQCTHLCMNYNLGTIFFSRFLFLLHWFLLQFQSNANRIRVIFGHCFQFGIVSDFLFVRSFVGVISEIQGR